MKLTITLVLLCLATYTLQDVKNGCTHGKCARCEGFFTAGTDQFTRRCTKCKDSKLTISGEDRDCQGGDTGIANCQFHGIIGANNALGCIKCKKGYFLSLDQLTCTATAKNCWFGKVHTGRTKESCIACENGRSVTNADDGGEQAITCNAGGTSISNCWIKTYRVGAVTTALHPAPTAGATITEICLVCNGGYSVQPDGQCLKHTDQHNRKCVYVTPFTNQCDECNHYHGKYAIGTVEEATTADNDNKNNGIQRCFSAILKGLLALGSFFMAFLAL